MTATDKALERRILHREEPVAELPHPDELAVVVSTRAWESGDNAECICALPARVLRPTASEELSAILFVPEVLRPGQAVLGYNASGPHWRRGHKPLQAHAYVDWNDNLITFGKSPDRSMRLLAPLNLGAMGSWPGALLVRLLNAAIREEIIPEDVSRFHSRIDQVLSRVGRWPHVHAADVMTAYEKVIEILTEEQPKKFRPW